MSKLSEQLGRLKVSINAIKEQMDKIKIENSLLLQQQAGLVSEKADLIKKNEEAREQIAAVLERIKNIETF